MIIVVVIFWYCVLLPLLLSREPACNRGMCEHDAMLIMANTTANKDVKDSMAGFSAVRMNWV